MTQIGYTPPNIRVMGQTPRKLTGANKNRTKAIALAHRREEVKRLWMQGVPSTETQKRLNLSPDMYYRDVMFVREQLAAANEHLAERLAAGVEAQLMTVLTLNLNLDDPRGVRHAVEALIGVEKLLRSPTVERVFTGGDTPEDRRLAELDRIVDDIARDDEPDGADA